MHITACLAGQDDVEVEVREDCRSLQALKEAIVKALPQLCVEGFDVSVGGRVLDDDEGVVSLSDSATLDVVPNICNPSRRALREAGREVSEEGLLRVAKAGEKLLVTLYLDAGVPIDCGNDDAWTPLHLACRYGNLSIATLLLNRGSRAIDQKASGGWTPLHLSCRHGHWCLVRLLLGRGSRAIDVKKDNGFTPLHLACHNGYLSVARLLLDRGSRAINEKNAAGWTPLQLSCHKGDLPLTALLLDQGCNFDLEEYKRGTPYSQKVLQLLSEGGHAVPIRTDTSLERTKRRRTGEQ